MKISGFTFIHNALVAGYPVFEAMAAVIPYVDEMVVVDMQSDDETRGLLDYAARQYRDGTVIKIVDGDWWPGKAGRCLSYNHSLWKQYCTGDVIWHFEADEVYDDSLAHAIHRHIIDFDAFPISVWRLQIEQNFQRIRWYPELVHRVWNAASDVSKSGHTTNQANDIMMIVMEPQNGFLWDVTNCFRDNWEARIRQQAELWGSEPNWTYAPLHVKHSSTLDHGSPDIGVAWLLQQPHWTWATSPFKLPRVLKEHVGEVAYRPLFHLLEVDYPWLVKM